MAVPFIKLCRSKLMEDVLDYPPAFIVLTHIALRARRDDTSYNPQGLKINQAFIGDVAKMKVTPREYRTAIKRLTEWRIIDKQATNKGTIVTLLMSDVYDINSETGDKQIDKQATSKPTSKRQLIEEDKNEEKELSASLFEKFWNGFDKKVSKERVIKIWDRLSMADRQRAADTAAVYAFSTPNKKYRKDPDGWLNGRKFEDEEFAGTAAQTPNEIPSNWPQGKPYAAPTSGTIPKFSEFLLPD